MHSQGTFHGGLKKIFGIGVKGAFVAAGQNLRCQTNVPQGFLQIMRRGICELFKLQVGAAQSLFTLLQLRHVLNGAYRSYGMPVCPLTFIKHLALRKHMPYALAVPHHDAVIDGKMTRPLGIHKHFNALLRCFAVVRVDA